MIKTYMSCIDFGSSQFFTAFILSSSIYIFWADIRYSRKANFIYIKLKFLEVGKKVIFSQLFKKILKDINIILAWVFSVDKNIIQVNSDKNIELSNQDLMNITLKVSWSIKKPKTHYLVLEMAVLNLKRRFSFITFFYYHLIISLYEIKLDILFG